MSPRVVAGASSDQAATAATGVKSESVDESALRCTNIPPSASTKNDTSNAINNPPHLFVENTLFLKHKRRYCRKEGCNSIVKSQGLCQRHGAKPKTCKVEGCTKQAQGNFDKMCKAHFKAMKRKTTPIPKVENKDVPPPAQGFSVYDEILPNSLTFVNESNNDTRELPLIVHLKDGFDTLKPPAWHRNEERRSRGMFPIDNPAAQLEGWERELVWMEILVLTGVPGASFRHLARAWGRDKGFHMVLAQFICERHGDVERKKRHGEKNNNKTGDNTGPCGNSNRKKRRKATLKAESIQNNKIEVDNSGGNVSGSGDYNNEDVGADVWDPSLYGDVDTNEALAAEIFDFTEKEFERVVSKYKQGLSSDISVSTSTTHNSRNISTSSTDMAAQAAMTAILGQHHQRTSSSTSTGHGQIHHPSNSMLSSVSNESSSTKDNQEDIIHTPVNVEVTAPAMYHQATTTQSEMVSCQSSATLALRADAQSYQDHLTPLSGNVIYAMPHQQMQQQQQIFQDQVQVQAPPIQVLGHTYQQQPQAMSPREGQAQGHTAPHQIMHQQPLVYNIHASTPSSQELQSHVHTPAQAHPHTNAQAQVQLQTESQTITQQLSIDIRTPTQSLKQSDAQAQNFSRPIPYVLPSGQQQQQQQHHALGSMPAPAQPTQFLQPQRSPMQQHQQNHHQINLSSYPQHKQEQLNYPASQHVVDVSYEQQQHQLQNYETVLPTNPLPQQTHAVPQQMVHAPVPQQQRQLQYTQTNIAPQPAPVQLAPRAHPQHQLPFPLDEHQQIRTQVEAPSQSDASSLPQVSGHQIIHHSYAPQQHLQEHLNQLINHPTLEPTAQDPLDVHHEMHATRQDQTDL